MIEGSTGDGERGRFGKKGIGRIGGKKVLMSTPRSSS
jgi:hypothetical protein